MSGNGGGGSNVPRGITDLVERTGNKAEDLFARPFPTYNGDRIEGPTSNEQQGWNLIRNTAQGQVGAQQLNWATDLAKDVGSSSVNAPMPSTSAGYYGLDNHGAAVPTNASQYGLDNHGPAAPTGLSGYGVDNHAQAVSAGQIGIPSGAPQIDLNQIQARAPTDLPGLQNKDFYTSFVNQQTLDPMYAAIERQRQQGISGNSSMHTLAGGEGAARGSRAGVSDSLTNEAAIRQAGELAASTGMDRLNAASGLMLHDIDANTANRDANLNRVLSGASTNAGLQQQNDQFGSNLRSDVLTGNANREQTQQGMVSQLLAGQYNSNANREQAQQGLVSSLLAGQYNSNADREQANRFKTADLTSGLAIGNADRQFAANQVNPQNRLAAAGLLGQLGPEQQQLALNAGGALAGAGAAERGIGQAQNDFNYQEFLRQVQEPYQKISAIASTYGASPNYAANQGGGKGGAIGQGMQAGAAILPFLP